MQRAAPLIALLVLTLFAAGSAAAVNGVIRSFVAPEAEALAALDGGTVEAPGRAAEGVAARSSNTRVKSEREYIDTIMRRNLFDPDAIASWNPSASKDRGPNNGDVVTDLKLTLLGTVVVNPRERSSALIAVDGAKEPAEPFNLNDQIQDATIIAIDPKVVTLRRGDGREEVLTMGEAPRKEPSTSGSSSGEPGGEVEQVADNKYAVDRATIDKYIGDIESISRMGRALLHRGPDGEFDGYRLSAIRRNTLADQLGIKNGDVVHAVNGEPLTSVQNAMGAYQTMMNEDSFSFEVTRRGQKMTLEYEIR